MSRGAKRKTHRPCRLFVRRNFRRTMRKYAKIVFFTILVFTVFLKVDPNFVSVEKRIYTHYTASLIEDFDFNVVNQIPEKEAWLLTPTFNYPDMHSNGVSLLWAPFFLISKWITHPNSNPEKLRIFLLAQAIANVFFGLLSLCLMGVLLRKYYSASIVRATLILFLFCTPFLWYLLIQPENADITALFLSTCLLTLYSQRTKFVPSYFSFLFGLSLFLCVAVKGDLIFWIPLFAHFLYERRNLATKKLLLSVFAFVGGSSINLFLIGTNEKIRYGYENYGYLDTITPQIYLLWENLFGPSDSGASCVSRPRELRRSGWLF